MLCEFVFFICFFYNNLLYIFFFFVSSRRRHTRYWRDWSSDVCSSDLLIRGRTKGRASLDDVMRRAYEEFYLKSAGDSYYLKGRAYTVEEFERLASETTGLDLSDFFSRYVRDAQPLPYEEALAHVGLRLTRITPTVTDAPRTYYRIERDDKAPPEAHALREAWLKGK